MSRADNTEKKKKTKKAERSKKTEKTDIRTRAVYEIREFNRFYTVLVGLLDRSYLNSDYSMAEARILFELKNKDGCRANDLAANLHMDKSYLSRMLKKFEGRGLLSKKLSGKDGRSYELRLTEEGRRITEQLIEASNEQIRQLLKALDEEECTRVCQAMDTITGLLAPSVPDK